MILVTALIISTGCGIIAYYFDKQIIKCITPQFNNVTSSTTVCYACDNDLNRTCYEIGCKNYKQTKIT